MALYQHIDIIIGGHDHSRQEKQVNGRWIFKADSDARSATVVQITLGGHAPAVEHRFAELGPDQPVPDAAVQASVDQWLNQHAIEYCQNTEPPSPLGCLEIKLGKTSVELLGEETEIRRFETNLGNWVADVSRDTFAVVCGPPVMFKYVCNWLSEQGMPMQRMFVSLERRMHCGMGKCCRCNVGSTYTCVSGPVFDYWSVMNLKEAI